MKKKCSKLQSNRLTTLKNELIIKNIWIIEGIIFFSPY